MCPQNTQIILDGHKMYIPLNMNYLSNATHISGRNKVIETCTALKHHFRTDIINISNMAESHVLSSSPKHTNFISENIDKESVELLNNQTQIIYDGIRIKWSKDHCSLKKFVHNVVGLNGVWKSPGG